MAILSLIYTLSTNKIHKEPTGVIISTTVKTVVKLDHEYEL